MCFCTSGRGARNLDQMSKKLLEGKIKQKSSRDKLKGKGTSTSDPIVVCQGSVCLFLFAVKAKS